MAGATQGALFKQFPLPLSLLLSLPDSFVTWLVSKMASFFSFQGVSSLSFKSLIFRLNSAGRHD